MSTTTAPPGFVAIPRCAEHRRGNPRMTTTTTATATAATTAAATATAMGRSGPAAAAGVFARARTRATDPRGGRDDQHTDGRAVPALAA